MSPLTALPGRAWLILAGALLVCLGGRPAIAVDAMAPAGPLPFQPGEELVYQIRWSFIPAGTAILKVLAPEKADGRPAQHFSLSVTTNRFIDTFYRVRTRVDGWTDMAVSHSVLYRKMQREGRHRRDVAVSFDWHAQTAHYTDSYRGKSRSSALLPGAFDPLSAAFYFRTLTLKKNMEIVYPVSDGKKCVVGRGTVVAREKIKVGGIVYDTWVVVPEIKHVGGVFKKSKHAKIHLWITADRRHLPVRLTSKVIVGHFVGDLVAAHGTLD